MSPTSIKFHPKSNHLKISIVMFVGRYEVEMIVYPGNAPPPHVSYIVSLGIIGLVITTIVQLMNNYIVSLLRK